MRFRLAIGLLVVTAANCLLALASEPIPACIFTLPVKRDPTQCFPEWPITTRLIDNRIDLEPLNTHPDRRLSLADGLVVFGVGGKFGYCDRDGVVRIKALYDQAQAFSEKRAVIEVDRKYGYVDTNGTVIVKPAFKWAYPYWKGLGGVQSGDLWGLLDINGEWVIRPKYKELSLLVGGIRVTTVDGREGWIDSTGTISRYE